MELLDVDDGRLLDVRGGRGDRIERNMCRILPIVKYGCEVSIPRIEVRVWGKGEERKKCN